MGEPRQDLRQDVRQDSHQDSRQDLTHDEAIALLPWLALDRLPQPELEAVLRHLAQCQNCRRELPYLGELGRWLALGQADQADHPDGPAEWHVDHHRLAEGRIEQRLRRLQERLPPPTATHERPRAAPRANAGAWWRQAALAQAALWLVCGAAWSLGYFDASPPTPVFPPAFQTLTTEQTEEVEASAAPRWRLVPAPGITEASLRGLLLEAQLVIVEGPSPLGVYTVKGQPELDLTRWQRDERLALLEKVAGSP